MNEKEQDKDFNIEVKQAFDQLERLIGPKPLYNELLTRASEIMAKERPRVARCLN